MRNTGNLNSDDGNKHYWYALALTCIFLCLPLLSVTYPPLTDYPNHLARAHVLYHYTEVPVYQARYDRVVEPLPNLAIDLVVPILLPFVDTITAGKIFLLLTLLLFAAGCHLLGEAAHGRRTWLTLPCLFFIYNSAFFYGFINYIVALGLFCVTLALRLRWSGRLTAGRLLVLASLTLIGFFAHLSAYFFLGVTFVIVAAWNYLKGLERLRAAALSVAPLVPPLVCFVAFMKGSGRVGQVEWGTAKGKLIGLLTPILSYNYTLDVVVAGAYFVILVVLARRLQAVAVNMTMLISAAVFALLYFIFPSALLTALEVDKRFVLPAVLLFVLSLKLSVPSRVGKPLLLLLLTLTSVRVAFIMRTWMTLDRRIAAEAEMLKGLPVGAFLYPVFVLPSGAQEGKVERAFDHVAHYATIYRAAFVPTMFAWEGQQPLLLRQKPRYIAPRFGYAEEWLQLAGEWQPLLANYDYVWSHGADERVEQLLAVKCTKVAGNGVSSLWRVNK